jgi:four helix bundle protein
MKDNIIETKSYQFALEIVRLFKKMLDRQNEFVMSKQILKSGTSIGANIAGALGAISKREFSAKMQISYKEAHETIYWLKILSETEFITKEEFSALLTSCQELIRILAAILKSSKL